MNERVKKLLVALDEIVIGRSLTTESALKILTIAAGGEDHIMDMLEEDDEVKVVRTVSLKTDSEGRLRLSKEIISMMEGISLCSSKTGVYVGLYKNGAFAAAAISELQLRGLRSDFDIIKKVAPTVNGEIRIGLMREFGPNAWLSVRVMSDGSAFIERTFEIN